jgi:hypothetical protein
VRRRLGFSIALLVLCGCSSAANDRAAKAATDAFHGLADAAEYGAIYDNASDTFKARHTRRQFVIALSVINHKMGKCESAYDNLGLHQTARSDTFVEATSSRACENGLLIEDFRWAFSNGKAIMIDYKATIPHSNFSL